LSVCIAFGASSELRARSRTARSTDSESALVKPLPAKSSSAFREASIARRCRDGAAARATALARGDWGDDAWNRFSNSSKLDGNVLVRQSLDIAYVRPTKSKCRRTVFENGTRKMRSASLNSASLTMPFRRQQSNGNCSDARSDRRHTNKRCRVVPSSDGRTLHSSGVVVVVIV
jgi:hypothetical protein